MSDFSKGSLWHKWDLHVHTPASIIQNFGNNDAAWDEYLKELEALPREFKVLGINDYYFLDGYEKLIDFKRNGRLSNIDLLLPVVEFRLENFAGVDFGRLKRINFHVIFSDELEASVIKSQFLNTLDQSYYLLSGERWSRVITRESIAELGSEIISSVPTERVHEFGTPLEEGFNNLNLKMDDIIEKLETNSCFSNKYLTAIGKTEWDTLNWSNSSIATKKTVINRVDMVFTAAESPLAFNKARKKLEEQRVNSLLLDCSDSHNFSHSVEKDRLGNCFSWIKGDSTFRGLQMALKEYENRVFIGESERPPEDDRVQNSPSQYMSELEFVRHSDAASDQKWFCGKVPINTGLVAIIGNKGSGKSALADTMALVGGSKNSEYFSFLSRERFKKPIQSGRSLAGFFTARLKWASGEVQSKELGDSVELDAVERVKYLPQDYIEKLCSELASDNGLEFERELKKVIFTHVPVPDRLENSDLDELLAFRIHEKSARIDSLLRALKEVSRERASLEEKSDPNNKTALEKRISLCQQEIEEHNRRRPHSVPNPAASVSDDMSAEILKSITALEAEIGKLESEMLEADGLLKKEKMKVAIAARLLEKIENFSKDYESLILSINEDAQSLDFSADELICLKISTQALTKKRDESIVIISEQKKRLMVDVSQSPAFKKIALLKQVAEEKAKLDAPHRAYQAYLKEEKSWKERLIALQDNKDDNNSLAGLKMALDLFEELPVKIGALREKQLDISRQIQKEKNGIKEIYQELYKPVQEFIDNHVAARNSQKLQFRVDLENIDFAEKLMEYINNNRVGSFYGAEDGLKVARSLIKTIDLSDANVLTHFLCETDKLLHTDTRSDTNYPVQLRSQLLQGVNVENVYDFLYGLDYIRPRYLLKWDDKDLGMLSPGERCTLLLMFYLLVDKSTMPLIIDQPEGNLDNQTVFSLIASCIREARKNRQVIIVTHNPNLAVVCDADQVIYAEMNKVDGNHIVYTSGSLENPIINKHVTDVLEGTKEAFEIRGCKYKVGLV